MERLTAYDIAHGTLKSLAAEIAKEQVKRHKFNGAFHLLVDIWVHVDDHPFAEQFREPDYEIELNGELKWNPLSNPCFLLDFFERQLVTWQKTSALARIITAAEMVAAHRAIYRNCSFDFDFSLRPIFKILA